MASRDGNAKIFIEAQLIDNFKQIASTLNIGLEKINPEIPIKVNTEEAKEAIEGALKSIMRMLNSNSLIQHLDLSGLMPQIFDLLKSGIPDDDKMKQLFSFESSLKAFERFTNYFEMDSKTAISAIHKLNDSLGTDGLKKYLTDLEAVFNYIDKLKRPKKDKDSLIKSLTDSFQVGVNSDNIADALSFQKIDADFQDVDKFALSAKEARTRLEEELENWEKLSTKGSKYKSATTANVIGYISRIEELSGKEFTQYLKDKIADKETSTSSKAQIQRLLNTYNKEGGWGEFYTNWLNSEEQIPKNALSKFDKQIKDRVKEMTRKQLEERQKIMKEYAGEMRSSQITQGIQADNSLVYAGEAEATQELQQQQEVRKDLADKTAKEIQTIREKLVLLKQIADLEKDVVAARVESSPEQMEMEALKEAINSVTEQVNAKTDAFNAEEGTVANVVKSEIKDLQKLKEKLAEVAGFEGEEKKIGRISKPRKKLEEQTEERKKELEEIKKAEEELRKEAENNVRKDSILGQLREEQEKKNQEANKPKPKATAGIKKKIKPDDKKADELSNKTVNEREAQALKEIANTAEGAASGLQKFGDVNAQITQNVIDVAQAIEKEADALNAMAKTFQKFDDSKIVQEVRKDKLREDLSLVQEQIKKSQEEVQNFQNKYVSNNSTGISIFNKSEIDETVTRLRNAYKDVASFRETFYKDNSKENTLEMAKREINLWKAYKKAEEQGITKSNAEIKTLTPKSLGIDSSKNADNIKLINDELNKKKAVVEEYSKEAERIQNEIRQVGKTSASKKTKEVENETKEYQEIIQIIKEYIEAQKTLTEAQEKTLSNNLQAQFNPEQLEQFNTVLNNMLESIGKTEQAVGTLGDKIDFSLILEQLQNLNDALTNFSSGLTFDDFKDIFTVTIDEAADKINEFKGALDLEAVTTKFEEQISRMQEKIEELQSQLKDNSTSIGQEQVATSITEVGNQISISYEDMETELANLEKELDREQKALKNQQAWIDWYDEALKADYTSKGKKDAFEKLQAVSRSYSKFLTNPEQSLATDKIAEENRYIVKHYKAYQEAQRQKVADSRLAQQKFSTDDSFFYKQAEQELEKQKKQTENLYSQIQQTITEKEARIAEIKQLLSQKDIQESTVVSSTGLTQEGTSFDNISNSAEQAAESKRKFVEANKEVIESIVASMPKIEEEAEALSSMGNREDVKNNIIENIVEPIQEGMDKYDEYFEKAMTHKQKRLDSYTSSPSKQKKTKLESSDEIKIEEEKNEELKKIQEAREKLFEQESNYRIEQNKQKQLRIEQEKKNTQTELEQARISEQAKAKIITEQVRLAEEARAKEQLIRQQQIKEYEKQFVDSENGQLTFFNENEYSQVAQEELNDIQKTVRDEAEKHPIEIPIKGQISFINNEGIEQIAQEIEKTERAILAKNSIGDFEKTFSKISGNKTFLQDTDIPTQFLKNYENLVVGKDKGTDVTANLRQLKNYGDELANIKAKLKVSFDENGKIKSIADPEEVQEALNRYAELTEKIERLKLIITAPTSQESFLLSELKKTEEEEEKLLATSEKVEAKTKKLAESKNFLSGKDVDISSLNKYFEVGETKNLDKVLFTIEEIKSVKEQIKASRNEQGVLIGDPKEVDNLLNKYDSLIKILEALKVQIQLPNSTENFVLKLANDAEKAKEKFDNLLESVRKNKNYGKYTTKEEEATGFLNKYLLKDAQGQILPVQQNAGDVGNIQAVATLKEKIEEYHQAYTALIEEAQKDDSLINQGAFTEAATKVETLEKQIQELRKVIRASGDPVADSSKVSMFTSQIETFLAKNPRLSEEAKQALQGYIKTLTSGATVTVSSLKEMTAGMEAYKASEEQAGNIGNNIWGQMAAKMREGVAFLATKFSFYQIFNQFRQGLQVVHEFDDALTEMQKVSDETRLSLERYQKTTFDTADAIGTTALQIQQSTADWMRLGESLSEAAKSAKASAILLNVSEFSDVNTATESLVAMSQAYNDLTKMDIIDKLNEVGNNYAVSTSEAATALQASASALKTANNDMDEALALITAGNAVVQDANKVGTGMRTIALRLTGTKSAKDALEELGEETDNVITEQSKLRDVIKEATAVASNEYKGFDILDDNGNYKSTYEIMLGIAEIYDEILETDKKFGRNNANLLLENVAGKVRANIAASIFQNPQLLKDAYKSSQEADNSAMKENEKYMASISGHLAQLKNAWQEMWANAINRDVINFFLDLAKHIVKLANTIGIIPTTLALAVPYLEIFKVGQNGKGTITQFLEWASNSLNEEAEATKEVAQAQEQMNAAKEAGVVIHAAETAATKAETEAKVEGAGASVAKAVADKTEEIATKDLAETEIAEAAAEDNSTRADLEGAAASSVKTAANLQEAASETGKNIEGTTGKVELLKKALDGLVGRLGKGVVAFGLFVGACVIAKKAYDAYQEAQYNKAKEATNNINQRQETLASQIESYKKLKEQLESGNLSEQETIDTKKKILEIQKEISNQYGSAAKGVDLINGKLEKQVNLLNSIDKAQALRDYSANEKGYKVAEKKFNAKDLYTVQVISNGDEFGQVIQNQLSKAGFEVNDNYSGGADASIRTNAGKAVKVLEQARENLEKLKTQYVDPDEIKTLDNYIKSIDEQLLNAYNIIDEYETTYLKGAELKLASRTDQTGYNAYQNYSTAVADLESAYISGNAKDIKEARKAFEEAKLAKDAFFKVDSNVKDFEYLFDSIDTSIIDTKNKVQDAIEIFKEAKKIGLLEQQEDQEKILSANISAEKKFNKEQRKQLKLAKQLYKLNPDRIDIEATLLDNTYASEKYSKALNDLIKAMDWSIDDTDTLINALISAGIVQGNATDATNNATDAFGEFSSSIDEAINNIAALNNIMTESYSGKGISTQNVEKFKEMFGDDAAYALEKTANGYHINVQKMYELQKQQTALQRINYASTLNDQYDALEKLNQEYQTAIAKGAKGSELAGYVEQRKIINDNIQKLQDKMMEYRAASSAYQTWITNQSNNGDREMYENIYSGFDTIKDEFEHGFAGVKTRSWLDLILNDENEVDFDVWTAPVDELKKRYEQLSKKIEGTGGYSVKDFFKTDNNGKITSAGIMNFFKAIENKQDEIGEEFVNIKEGWFNFTENGDYKVADLLGIDVETVQAILRAAYEAGASVELDEPIYSLEKLREEANESKDSLEKLTEKKFTVDLNPENIDEANDSILQLENYYNELQNRTTIEPEVKAQELEHLSNIIEYLIEQKRIFAEDELFSFQGVDDALEAADERIDYSKKKLISFNAVNKKMVDELNSINLSSDNADELWESYAQIYKMKEDLNLNPEVDSEQIQYFDDLLQSILEKISLINNTPTEGKNLTFSQYEKGLEVVDKINETIQKANEADVNFDFNWQDDTEFMEMANWIDSLSKEQKIQLGLDPDTNTEQIIDLANNGLELEIKTDKGKQQVQQELTSTQELPAVTHKITEEEVKTHLSQTIDTFDLGKEAREEAKQDIENLNNDSKAIVEIDADIEGFNEKADEANQKISEVDKEEAKPSVTLLGLGQVLSAAASMQSAINNISGKTVDVKADVDYREVDTLLGKLDSVINKKNSANSITVSANGTAHIGGTAFARGNAYRSGDWGIPKDETALVGELGTEIAVTPDGKWQTIGEDGAEFAKLKKGTIIFNHKQSEELLKNGYVTSNGGRGHLVGFANGTAYSNGTLNLLTPTVSSGGNNGGGGNNNGGGGNGKSSSDKAKETKNTLDEVEILIARIERQISRLDNTIGNVYIKWANRNDAIRRNLEKVSKEIKDQNDAYNTYMKKAKSVGLPEEWAKKVREGKQAIENVDDSDLWQKIQDYKTWYEKALAAQDKVQELQQKQGELYKQRFDNEQTYYEEVIENLQHTIDIMGSYNDQLEEGGKLTSRNLIIKQISVEQAKLQKLRSEYEILNKRRDEAVNSGKIKKGSEAWYEMQQAINEVCEAIVEAETNLISYNNAFREVNWNRWDRVHDAISGVVNELEFLYDLINEDEMFDDTGTITNYGITAFGILTQEYDTYAREIERYQKEINTTQKELEEDPYNQDLVDKLKEQKEAQQDAASGLKKMKDAMIDVAENGIKKQIDYIKRLIDEYTDLLEAEKDQIDYANKVADQQKEINKLEKQYRAIQNDTSEEGATRRQKLKDQIEEKRRDLQETQEDRRISETKDLLSDFEEKFEEFLENKLKDIEGIIKEGINGVNNNTTVVVDTIESLAASYGYTPSDTLKNTLTNLSNNLVSYFNGTFENENVRSIAQGVDAIVSYYNKAQKESNRIAMADKVKETGTHMQAYVDEKGKTHVGYFDNNGNRLTNYTGRAKNGDKIYRFENGTKATGEKWITENGKKSYINKDSTYATGFQTINGKKYYFDSQGQMQAGWKTINGKKYHFNKEGVMHTGLVTIANRKFYFDANGVLQTGKWQTINGKKYYLSSTDGHILTGKQTINGQKYTFYNNGVLKKAGWKKGTASVPSTGYAWTNEGRKAEAIIRKSDGAILTPLNKGDSVIPSSAMKNMYKALTDPEKYLKQYTTPDIKVVQATNKSSQSSPTFNVQFIANGVQDATKFANELMNNKKIEKWIQEVTLGQANGNNAYRKYSYVIR